ncbi:MAG: hypothetical protein Kow0062_23450 [Acidobacteriota bacterium]
MRYRSLVFFVVGAALAGVATVLLFGGSGHVRESMPLGLRYEWLESIPGVNRLVLMEAHYRARRDLAAGRHVLFGYGLDGQVIPGAEDCRVVMYKRGVFSADQIPAWAAGGITGTMVIDCGTGSAGRTSNRFNVVEMGCLGWGRFWASAYNQATISRWRQGGDNSVREQHTRWHETSNERSAD